jgi:hypothetical protein
MAACKRFYTRVFSLRERCVALQVYASSARQGCDDKLREVQVHRLAYRISSPRAIIYQSCYKLRKRLSQWPADTQTYPGI